MINRLRREIFWNFIKGFQRRELGPNDCPRLCTAWAWTDDDDKQLNWRPSLSELTRDSPRNSSQGDVPLQEAWLAVVGGGYRWALWRLDLALTTFSKKAAMEDAEGVEGVDTASTIGQPICFRSGPLAGRLIRCAYTYMHITRPSPQEFGSLSSSSTSPPLSHLC